MINIKHYRMTTLTLNLSDSIKAFLRSISKKLGKTQREIVERALKNKKKALWKKEIIRESKEFFDEIKNDPELLAESKSIVNYWA